ncbi:type VII secretion protein EccB [Streptomyces sp. NPDC053427]|uniref:type VII secretion protein EccB n=1 Tax=Streptomyces sp. NPDC053427 TaxID=3365701 RepID=UPI0037CF0FD8
MASRRDELNAYSFARKRTNASFLKPLPNGSIESAPKPLKAVVPGIVVSVLILVGFGACGIIKPVAPQGWDTPEANVVVGADSTTRYVVLKHPDADGNDQKMLHPILNLASAKLLLDPDKFNIVQVKESELDSKIAHGPAVGIPYAPDRLPGKSDVDKAKTWAVCNRPGSGVGSKPQQAVFLLSGKDKKVIEDLDKGRVDLHKALYVEGPDGVRYLVDQYGIKFTFDSTLGGRQQPPDGMSKAAADRDIRRIIFGDQTPQPVTQEWLDTLIDGQYSIFMPSIPGAGQQLNNDDLPQANNKVGNVVQDGSTSQKYVVTQHGVEKVSDFIAKLLTLGPNARKVTGTSNQLEVKSLATASFHKLEDDPETGQVKEFMGTIAEGSKVPNPWPTQDLEMANNFEKPAQDSGLGSATDKGVSCSAYLGTNSKYAGAEALGYPKGVPNMATWVGTDYPAKIASGSSTYVTPGSGLLYRAVSNPTASSGSTFLITDTGLRYNVPNNNDSKGKAGNDKEEQGKSMLRLGYKGTHPPDILTAWSNLLSEGPSLEVHAAEKLQSS